MPDEPDFDFSFGRYRRWQGRGWRGLVALALIGLIVIVAGSLAHGGIEWLSVDILGSKPRISTDRISGKAP